MFISVLTDVYWCLQVMFVGDIPVHPHVYSNGHICLSVLTDVYWCLQMMFISDNIPVQYIHMCTVMVI